jgi:hypothetical protein
MFHIPQSAISAPQFKGEWEPQVHFTGNVNNAKEVQLVQNLIDRYQKGLVAYYFYYPFTGNYSLELQWDDDKVGEQVIREYNRRGN